jgi:hypothetical protein
MNAFITMDVTGWNNAGTKGHAEYVCGPHIAKCDIGTQLPHLNQCQDIKKLIPVLNTNPTGDCTADATKAAAGQIVTVKCWAR